MSAGPSSSGLVHPVVLSGGVGTRLWPLSRALYPKQLLRLTSDTTMLQDTVARFTDTGLFTPPLVICNDEHRFIVAEQLREIGVSPQAIVLEPEGRNTAPAAAVAAIMLEAQDADALLLLLPSDHTIADVEGFHAAARTAAQAAREQALVTFGMAPHRPETGYGYIRAGEDWAGVAGCHQVERFVEKPESTAAEAMLKEGGWLWNSGMFLFSARAYLEELDRHSPSMVSACRAAVEQGAQDLDFFRLDARAFAKSPVDSIDYAVMEKTKSAAVVPASVGWSDVGSWSALWEIGDKDEHGNVLKGEVLAQDTGNSYIRAEKQLVAVLGVSSMVIVATEDAVLVAPMERAQDVKRIVERLKHEGSQQHISHVKVLRPWGSYQGLDAGDRFQVKHLNVKPGAKLSLQKHNKRAEHWVVVRGTARVTRGEEVFDLQPNESTYIPLGTVHRLENPGSEPLSVIEIQSGEYLGEDDIVRLDDIYGRSES
jgi:mannose-1-phosphate guanylyltransferase/mannose-1-phosphate guanylyltransferase/mannose-6-phosphate isomerase